MSRPLHVVCKEAVEAAMAEAGYPPPLFVLDDPDFPEEATLIVFAPDDRQDDDDYAAALSKALDLVAARFGWPPDYGPGGPS